MNWNYYENNKETFLKNVSLLSNNHVVVHEMPMSAYDPLIEPQIRLMCVVCMAIVRYNFNLDNTAIHSVINFCGLHKHESYKAPDSPDIKDIKNPITIVKPPPYNPYVSTPGYSYSKSVSTQPNIAPEILKIVYKLSDFNVDLQSKPSIAGHACRAYCNSCGEAQAFQFNKIKDMVGDEWVELGIFCSNHRHETVIPAATGRKFKDAY